MQIINDLERFRVMRRDDIIDLYFKHLKNPVTNANYVLKRLVRDNKIKVNTMYRPYMYFPIQSTIKNNSTKIPHFLDIVDVYKQIKQYFTPKTFIVEPKYKKGLAEPDIFTQIMNIPLFIEVQRNHYSQKVMNDKINRYEALYYSDEIQGKFPFIVLISDKKYEINSDILTVFQVESMQEFLKNINKALQKDKKTVRIVTT